MNTSLITVTFKVSDMAKEILQKTKELLQQNDEIQITLAEPHVTIYQCKIPENLIEKAVETLLKLAQQTQNIRFEPNGLNIKNEYVGIAYKKSEEILSIHKTVVEQLNLLRGDLVRSVYVEERDSYSPVEQHYIDTYGYPYVFDEYMPHIALMTVKNSIDIQKINEYNIPMIDFTSSGFEIVVMSRDEKYTQYFEFMKK